MATVRTTTLLCHGTDVLYDVCGRGFTITFKSPPTQEQIDEWGDKLDRQVTDEIEAEQVPLTEEMLTDGV